MAAVNRGQVLVMRAYIAIVVLVGALTGCRGEDTERGVASRGSHAQRATATLSREATAPRRSRPFAGLPDKGQLLRYEQDAPIHRSAYTWHAVQLSEEHALRAVVAGELVIPAPDGRMLHLRYERHVEHPDGNWTWVGRPEGAPAGAEAIITFGEKAVFGTIPYGDRAPLRLTSTGGRAWLMETDPAAVAKLDSGATRPRKSDALLPPSAAGDRSSAGSKTAAAQTTAAALPASNTVDVLLGYTSTFASRLGGQSQAATRLNFIVDVANQAFRNSQVTAELRLVKTLQVSYPDATANSTALYELTGVSCTETSTGLHCVDAETPASLQPLLAAREQYGADLVSLVRNFNDPENDGCGIAWLIGGGQTTISSADAYAGMSVVSDSNGTGPYSFPDGGYVCRDESLAHEIGHNLGSAHDRDTADGDDNILQQGEYGRFPYSFGYKTGSGSGNFFTVMAYGDSGQANNRVFSNPDVSTCGPLSNPVYPCGVPDQDDNARSLRQTIPVIAAFRAGVTATRQAMHDLDGDGKSELLWHKASANQFAYWVMNGAAPVAYSAVTALAAGYQAVASGDFNGDGYGDILWSNGSNLSMRLGSASGSGVWQAAGAHPAGWVSLGALDISGDGKADLLWFKPSTNQFAYWLMNGNVATAYSSATNIASGYQLIAAGDFNGDGYGDLLWSNNTNMSMRVGGANGSANWQLIGAHPSGWTSLGALDISGDGRADLLWRQPTTNQFAYWVMNGTTATSYSAATSIAAGYQMVATGDFNGDGFGDLLWSNGSTLSMRLAGAGGGASWQIVGSQPAGWTAILR